MATTRTRKNPPADAGETWAEGGCGVDEAVAWAGVGRTRLYAAMADGSLVWTKVRARRIVSRLSLRALLSRGAAQIEAAAR